MAPGTLGSAYRRDRRGLIERLQSAGIEDLAVLHAFDTVPRHLFVPEAVRHRAYEDVALPLGFGQTISRPGVHALQLSLANLQGTEKVLEVGTGSGFLTALLAVLTREVYSVETVPELARAARARLEALNLRNVRVRTGDGSVGWPEHAPYDAIVVGAAAPEIPEPLRRQLADGGRLLIPVGGGGNQQLIHITREEGEFRMEPVEDSRFVPLVGEEGW